MCSVREGLLRLGAAHWGVFALGVDRVRNPLEQRGVVCEGRDMPQFTSSGLAKKWSSLAARMRSRAASLSALRATKAASAASLVLGMGWSAVAVSGTIRLVGAPRLKRRVRRDSAPFIDTRRRGSVDTVLTRAENAKSLPIGRPSSICIF